MSASDDLAARFTSPTLDRASVKAFADHIAKVETQTGLKPKKVLVNGIPPFHDIPTVEFDVPKAKFNDVIAHLLANGRIKPNVLINGIPSLDHYHVKVMAGG